MRTAKVIATSTLLLTSLVTVPAVTAPSAAAGCVKSSGITVCDQNGGSDNGPVVPYPCEFDWYCYDGSEWDLGLDVSPPPPPRPNNDLPRPDRGRPGTPGNRPGGGGGGGGRR
ncbi:hypothetical protein MHN84_02365 [Mycobacterium sp. PSTR-4-N]|nr:hypothetical protein [Mycobacterium sp. PSTR-4-N]MCG7592839.1 hypothetical protein [Mycobacterium sp. PSTR-4-N]